MSDSQSNTSAYPVDSTQVDETVVPEVDRQSENSTNTGEVALTEQEKKDKKDNKTHQRIEAHIRKPYTKPSDETRRAFERYHEIARLHANRLYANRAAGNGSGWSKVGHTFVGTSGNLPKDIQEKETRLQVTWSPDDFHEDGGYYKDKDREYKDFVGDPCAGGSGGVPCMADPDVWNYTCGEYFSLK